jgi:hypothetical protein
MQKFKVFVQRIFSLTESFLIFFCIVIYKIMKVQNGMKKPILILLLVLFVSIQSVKGQSAEEQARNLIANLDDQIRAATDALLLYWNNITDATRYEVLSDIQKAWQLYGGAKGLYDIGQYNASLEEAYWAIFVAHRATYRIFLKIAEIHVARANSTINAIPSYIPQPIDAKNKLKQASELYEDAYLPEIFRGYPSVEIAPDWINAMFYAEKKLYWDYSVNVVKLADEAWIYAVDWRKSQEASQRRIIEEQIISVKTSFYVQLLIPSAVDLIFSLIFLVPMMVRFSGWAKRKSSHKIIWDGNLWNRKWVWSSIIPTLGTLAIFCGLLWGWIQSVYGLSRTYEVTIPLDLIGIVGVILWILVTLLVCSSVLFIINKCMYLRNKSRWQQITGLSFTLVLILEIILSLITVSISGLSLGQIYHAILF